jgi:hypothetical protein
MHGAGRHFFYVPLSDIVVVLKLEFAGQLLWIWALTFVKLSVALSMIRVTPSRRWQIVLYCFNGFLVVTAVLFVILQLVQCKPISGNWHPGPGNSCWNRDGLAMSGYISGGKFDHVC